MKRLFVSGDRTGRLQSIRGETAKRVLAGRSCCSDWWKDNYPIIYELVPIDEAVLRLEAAEAAKE